jgi:signal transduction histidine kinase
MPGLKGHPVASSGLQWELVAAILVAALGLGLYAWWRADPAEDSRRRIRRVAWCLALLAAVGILTASIYSAVSRSIGGWWPVLPVATVLLVLLRPGLAQRILPAALIALGVLGLAVAHQIFTAGQPAAGLAGVTGSGGWYGITHVGLGLQQDGDELILPQAYLFLVLGGWLGWHELRDHPAAARLLLGRTAAVRLPERPWGLLLVPLALAVSMLATNWAEVAIPLLVIAVLLIWYWPRRASQLAALGLVAFVAFGLVAAQNWHVNSLYVAPGKATAANASPELQLKAAPHKARGQPTVVSSPGYAVPPPAQLSYPQPTKPGRNTRLPSTGTPATELISEANPALFGLVAVKGESTLYAAYVEGLLLICFCCWLVPQTFPGVARLLGLSTDAALARRVQRLTESRAVAVDTAAADLRRLERDLHDGAQARLVALGMNLRAAERLIHTSPDAAAALVAEARAASARALTELRELVRGVHPPVLADRGLADAIRALALDSPLYVQTEIDLAGRPPAPVETACYFAVAELLTNAAKHSGARQAAVSVSHADGRLRIEVTDFGLGGADAARGSGLAGVEKRLASFDGILAISSPVGGPTIVVLEVPCALSSPRISSS